MRQSDSAIVKNMERFKEAKHVHITNPKELFGAFSTPATEASFKEVRTLRERVRPPAATPAACLLFNNYLVQLK